jgi:hypothetical protein
MNKVMLYHPFSCKLVGSHRGGPDCMSEQSMRDLCRTKCQGCRSSSELLCFICQLSWRQYCTLLCQQSEDWQDRKCTYNVTLWRVVQHMLQWESSTYYILCVCVFSNAHETWYPMWPAWLCSIIPHYLMILENKFIENNMCILIFSANCVNRFSF